MACAQQKASYNHPLKHAWLLSINLTNIVELGQTVGT